MRPIAVLEYAILKSIPKLLSRDELYNPRLQSYEGRTLTIAELGALGEFIGSIAVLITLIYLAVQIRQNSRNVQSQTINSQATQLQKFAEIQAIPDVMAALKRVYVDREKRPDFTDATLIEAYLLSGLFYAQAQYLHKAAGLITDTEWKPAENFMATLFGTEYAKLWWKEHGSQVFDEGFVREVDRIAASYKGDFWTSYEEK